MKRTMLSIVGSVSLTGLGCGEAGDLALSAGAPATAAAVGRITDCGTPVAGAAVMLLVQQDESGQSRSVYTRTRAVVTDRAGGYLVDIAPAFAIPGPAAV